MATIPITRHFATIERGRFGARQVHYRRAGSGPVVICFHQSPLSSRDMLATMRRWSDDFTVIAPDTPGFGLSDPLGVPQAEMSDFADAAIEFMDAIGVEQAAVYGFHTGAMVSGALAAAHPGRIRCAVANGYVVLTEAERLDLVSHYLPAFAPAWDGSHLTWLWSRMREQTIFFPWYAKTLAERLDYDLPSPAALHEGLLDFMRSGDHYRVGYRAAFTMRSDLALQQAQVPVLVTAADSDVLAQHLPRILRKSDGVTVQEGGTQDQTLDLCHDFLLRHAAGKRAKPAPKPAATRPLPGRLWSQFIDVPGGQLRIRRNDDAGGRPVLVQHDAAGSSEVVHALASGFIGKRPVIAINLPGHGESDNVLPKGKVTVTAYARAVLAALPALGIGEFDFIGTWGGGLVGLELALLEPARVRHLALADLIYFDDDLRADLLEHYTPDIQPVWYGGHLLEAWHLLRDQGLFWPWYDRTRKGAIRQPIYVDPVMVHSRVLELFRSNGMWRQAYQAHFSYPTKSKLAKALGKGVGKGPGKDNVPMTFVAPSWDPQLGVTQQAARDFPQAAFRRMPDDMCHWADELLPFFDA